MKKSRKKKAPKRVLRLPDLDYAKGAVLNTLGSPQTAQIDNPAAKVREGLCVAQRPLSSWSAAHIAPWSKISV
jgi:hypothetical protein